MEILGVALQESAYTLASYMIILMLGGSFVCSVVYAMRFLIALAAKQELGSTQPFDAIFAINTVIPQNNTIIINNSKEVSFIDKLKQIQLEIEDKILYDDIQKLIDISLLIEKQDTIRSRDFFKRYDGVIDKLLLKYNEIEDFKSNNEDFVQTMTSIKEAISKTVLAFEKELSNVYKLDLLDVEAETNALIQNMKNRGLLDNNNLTK